MTTLTASEARASLYRLIDETSENHQPVLITGKRHNAVLVSADDWAAIQETLYLLSVPGMRESIREGMEAPIDACSKELAWGVGSCFLQNMPRKMRKNWLRPG